MDWGSVGVMSVLMSFCKYFKERLDSSRVGAVDKVLSMGFTIYSRSADLFLCEHSAFGLFLLRVNQSCNK